MRSSLWFVVAALLLSSSAMARTVEPGAISLSGGVGPGIRLGDRLGGSGAYLLVMGQGEYALNSSVSGVADLSLGLAGTIPFRVHLGGRYRLADLDLPISPYGQVQLGVGRLWDVIGANLTYVGVRFGAGADYFLTAQFAVGGLLALDVGSTLGERPAFYGVVDIFAVATYTL